MKTKLFLLGTVLLAFVVSAGASPITNTAFIRTNLIFNLKTERGPFTNKFGANDMLVYNIIPTPATNAVFYRRFPYEQSFDFHLFDEMGKEVVKTKGGLANSQPVHSPKSRDEAAKLKGRSLPVAYTLFRPSDMFVITNQGIYELEIRIRLWAQTTNNGPNNEMMSRFDKSLGTNANFGVVVSDLVRVRVIKD